MRKTARPERRLPLSLPPDLYNRLAEEAARAERDPIQQVRFFLREALGVEAEPVEAPK